MLFRSLNELSRIASHLVWLGTHAIDIGAMSVFLYCFREREEILKIFELVSGQRMMTSYFRVGGLALEPPPEFLPRVRHFMSYFPERLREYESLLTRNPIWKRRTIGVGILTKDVALDFAATGPTARGSGIDYDIRRDHPYSGYENFQFEVPVQTDGDVYSRYLVRIAELHQRDRKSTRLNSSHT